MEIFTQVTTFQKKKKERNTSHFLDKRWEKLLVLYRRKGLHSSPLSKYLLRGCCHVRLLHCPDCPLKGTQRPTDLPLQENGSVKDGISTFLWHSNNFERICSFVSIPFEKQTYNETVSESQQKTTVVRSHPNANTNITKRPKPEELVQSTFYFKPLLQHEATPSCPKEHVQLFPSRAPRGDGNKKQQTKENTCQSQDMKSDQ